MTMVVEGPSSRNQDRFVAYWKGCSPLIVRGALLTAGQMFGTLLTREMVDM